MGGSESKSVVNNLSKQITDIAISTSQTCEVLSDQSQTVNMSNSGFKLWSSPKVTQATEIRSDCFSDSKKELELQNKIIQAISQAATSQNVALLGAFGKSTAEASANLQNIVRNNIKMKNIQAQYNQIKQSQTVNYNNSGIMIVDTAEFEQGSKVFAAATLKEVEKAGLFSTVATYADQSSSAKMENPLDFIAKVVGSITTAISSSVIFFVILVAAVVLGFFYVLGSGGGGGGQGGDQNAALALAQMAMSAKAGVKP